MQNIEMFVWIAAVLLAIGCSKDPENVDTVDMTMAPDVEADIAEPGEDVAGTNDMGSADLGADDADASGDECSDDQRCADGAACWPNPELGRTLCEPVDWSCAGNPWPTPMVAQTTVLLYVQDGLGPIENAAAKACAADDVNCATPLAMGTTDGNGNVPLTVPAGFFGYFEATAPGYATTLVHPARPYIESNTSLITIMTPLDGIEWAEAITLDPTRGFIATLIQPCNIGELSIVVGGGAQLVITSDLADGATITGYTSAIDGQGIIDASLTSTTVTGFAAMANHPPGLATLTYTNSAGDVVATRSVVVRAAALSYIWAMPTP